MKKKETSAFNMFEMAIKINKSNLEKIYWMEEFINYIEKNDKNLYKKARKYADKLEADDYFTQEDKKKWGIK